MLSFVMLIPDGFIEDLRECASPYLHFRNSYNQPVDLHGNTYVSYVEAWYIEAFKRMIALKTITQLNKPIPEAFFEQSIDYLGHYFEEIFRQLPKDVRLPSIATVEMIDPQSIAVKNL